MTSDVARALEQTSVQLRPAMDPSAFIQFETIVLQDQRVRGGTDDYLLSVVHLVVQFPDGHCCRGCVASVRHRFRGANGGAVEISVAPAEECAPLVRALEPSLEEYYRDHVGAEGTAIRVGPRGASPWLVGTQRVARATVPLPTSGTQ